MSPCKQQPLVLFAAYTTVQQNNPSNLREDLDGRMISVESRTDGKAWEDLPPEHERDPVSQAFRDARLQCQVISKKQGTKEFPNEIKLLEAKLKRLEVQIVQDKKDIIKKQQCHKRDSNVLQRNLREARENMQSTMVQAADDVLILTQKLQEVEERFAQCRVDKDHLESVS